MHYTCIAGTTGILCHLCHNALRCKKHAKLVLTIIVTWHIIFLSVNNLPLRRLPRSPLKRRPFLFANNQNKLYTDNMDADITQLNRYQTQIAQASSRGIPIAVQQTVNNTARNAWRSGRKNTDSEFKNRNTWTKRSQTYQTTKELDIDSMVSVAGSSAGYLAEQETGFTRTSTGKAGVWVPTADAAGQTGDRTKPILRRFRKGRMRLRRKVKKQPTSAAQARLFKMHDAVQGNGLMWGKLGSTEGMWHLTGSSDGGRLILTGVRLLYSANKQSISTRAHEWHEPAVRTSVGKMGDEYHRALKRQWTRLKKKNRL